MPCPALAPLAMAVLLTAHLANVPASAAIAGPYKLALVELGPCPGNEVGTVGDDMVILGNFHHNRSIGPDPVFTGNATIKNDCMTRGATSITINVGKWDPVSGWRDNFMVMPLGEFCGAMVDVGRDVLTLVRSGVNEHFPNKCPVPNGLYTSSNTIPDLGQLAHFPALPYGRFRVHMLGYHLKKASVKTPRLCVRMVANVYPKVKKVN